MKNGGTSWQYAASLPARRTQLRGVGLDHGKFLVTGEYCENKQIRPSNIIYTQEDITVVPDILIYWFTICKATDGPQWVSFPQSATFMPSLWFLERQWTTVSDDCNAL